MQERKSSATYGWRQGARRLRVGVAASAGLALTLAACGGGGEPGGDEDGQITLEFPSWQVNEPGNGDVLKAIVEEFESRHDNVDVNLYYVSNDDFQNQIVTRLASKD